VNVPLIVAGSIGVVGAGIHGAGGEFLVLRKLSPAVLPSSAFGGPSMTRTMIRAAWHLTTIAFLTVGSALLVAGSVAHGETARGMALVAAAASSGFGRVVRRGPEGRATEELRDPSTSIGSIAGKAL
jgi:hypothetical protein